MYYTMQGVHYNVIYIYIFIHNITQWTARSLARSVSTAERKGLLLSRSILVWNSRCCVSVKKARKEWHPPKKVLNSADIEGRDRRGLVQLPNSICLHGASGLKVQILKGTKEH
jgi:hypothetical protein